VVTCSESKLREFAPIQRREDEILWEFHVRFNKAYLGVHPSFKLVEGLVIKIYISASDIESDLC
jgi:hypothetical protein